MTILEVTEKSLRYGAGLSRMIEYAGLLLYHRGEDQQRTFDSTCRKFRRFLERNGSLTLTNFPDEAHLL